MKRLLLVTLCALLCACNPARDYQSDITEPVVTAPPLGAVACIECTPCTECLPCPACPQPVVSAPVAPLVDDVMPTYRAGGATVRLAVSKSRKAAEHRVKVGLGPILGQTKWWPHVEVWGTRSGKAKSVRARIQVSNVHPEAGAALCAHLTGIGWDPGPLPCEIRRAKR